jgi:3-deoxy-7-phosphoheptulonate synthase
MPVDDCRIREMSPLLSPRALRTQLPLPDAGRSFVESQRRAVRAVLRETDPKRLVAIVGPCSIHDPKAALEYADRLSRVAEVTRRELVLVMRAYFEKPRTVVGWKGLVSDPRLDGSCDIESGLALARSILLRMAEIGVAAATEFLDPIVPAYLADLVTWAAVGARTTESQTHREMASGLPMPVGFKNAMDGSLESARNAVTAARHAHSFPGINADGFTTVLRTAGNPDGHVVLRGGETGGNYYAKDIARAVNLVRNANVARGVIIDCSHGNSRKDPENQAAVLRSVLDTLASGQRGVLGFMLESHLRRGQQSWAVGGALRYGVSITDACIGWEETERLLYDAADRVAGVQRSAAQPDTAPLASW